MRFSLFVFLGMLITAQWLGASSLNGQNLEAVKISLSLKNETLIQAFQKIEKQTSFRFMYRKEDVRHIRGVSHNGSTVPLTQLLNTILAPNGLTYRLVGQRIMVMPGSDIPEPGTEVLLENAVPLPPLRGRVTDEKGEGLPGVSILLKGTQQGTVTDGDGNFTINVPDENAVLVFSFVGYASQEMVVGNRTSVELAMQVDQKSLEEVVVVGYGTQTRQAITGAVSSVDLAKVSETRPITNVASGLAGLVPGLYVRSGTNDPGSNATLMLRGQGTLNNSAPLVIIDGVEGDISRLPPQDISSISVLKDASSAAIYGSRAANGVILITTRQGSAGKIAFSYDGYYATQNVGRLIPLVDNSVEYMELLNEAARNSNLAQVFSDGNIQSWKDNEGGDPLLWPNSNWGKSLFRTAHTFNHNITASGGTDKITSFLSFNYAGAPGIIENTGYDRYSIRSNTNIRLTQWLKLGANLNGTLTDKERGSSNLAGMFENSILAVPTVVDRHPDGRFGGTQNIEDNQVARSPVWYVNALNGINKTQTLFARFYANLNPLKGLNINSSYTYNTSFNRINTTPTQNDTWNFQTNTVQSSGVVQLYVTNQQIRTQRDFMDIDASYEYTLFNKLYARLMAGASQEQYEGQQITVTRQGLIDENLTQINAATGAATASGNLTNDWAMQSYFGRLNLAWEDRYLLELNLRRDGSSRFTRQNRWGYFPSVSAGWRIDQEKFFKSRFIDELKIRASYGGLGNNAVGDYDAISSLTSTNYVFNNTPFTGFYPAAIANTNLRWETTYVTNAGLDFGLFNRKFTGSVDVYNKETKNILISLPAPLVRGTATAPPLNSAQVRNRGIEAALNWKHSVGPVGYFVRANFAFNKNLVVKFKGDEYSLSGISMIKEGLAINTPYVMAVDRIVQNQEDLDLVQGIIENAPENPSSPGQKLNPFAYGVPELGDLLYKDLNGDGLINDTDRYNVGKGPNPRVLYSFNVGGDYKGFDFSVFIDGVSGKDTYFLNNYYTPVLRQTIIINREIADGRWYSGRDTPATYPRVLMANTRNTQASDFWLQDMSFLKIRNIQVGYTLPASVQSKLRTSRIRVYATLENFFTFTDFKGLDPEVDNVNYPTMKQAVFGINLTF